ncbi:DUF2730 family protein [Rhizobium paknamense]|uniref:23S rRNA maturation-related 3'-5' exoribonuclease YhaM n=1 Tax=Rhizobium paknamense TaxID=1206817 RepID=A0ABU0IAM0_9HYPH|nr:DUF2730 family protein [Rhizobium paknamense]MDQ0454703.1 23S rRNA maturation-related 3'-5' exoribonuclease YhaM [Rhizobium paknamense]
MILDLTAIASFIAVALSGLNLLALIRNMLSSGERKLDERITKVEGTLIEHDRRVQAVEGELKHMPDKETVQKLQLDMAEMKAQLTAMVKATEATERATRRVEDFLLKRGAD